MTKYDDIYELAADNFGVVTSTEARKMHVSNLELVKLASRGKLERIGHGVYKLKRFVPTQYDPYAEAIALVGADAYLFGESVIELLRLAPTNPAWIRVATAKRVRKNLPEYLQVVHRIHGDPIAYYEGIRCQRLDGAITSCLKTMMPERLEAAAHEAKRIGLVTIETETSILRELGI